MHSNICSFYIQCMVWKKSTNCLSNGKKSKSLYNAYINLMFKLNVSCANIKANKNISFNVYSNMIHSHPCIFVIFGCELI